MHSRLPRKESSRTPLPHLRKRVVLEFRRVHEKPITADAVHDARVAARRLAAALELWACPSRERDRVVRDLNRAVRRLGRLRNVHVVLRILRKESGGDPLIRVLRVRMRKEQSRLAEWLGGRRIEKIRSDLSALIHSPGGIRRAEPQDLWGAADRISSLLEGMSQSWDPEAGHELRRELRLLRYAHESLKQRYVSADFDRAQRVFLNLQDAGGVWHDWCILKRLAGKAVKRGWVSGGLRPLRQRITRKAKLLGVAYRRALRQFEDLTPLLFQKKG